jgi:hypothetical protein
MERPSEAPCYLSTYRPSFAEFRTQFHQKTWIALKSHIPTLYSQENTQLTGMESPCHFFSTNTWFNESLFGAQSPQYSATASVSGTKIRRDDAADLNDTISSDPGTGAVKCYYRIPERGGGPWRGWDHAGGGNLWCAIVERKLTVRENRRRQPSPVVTRPGKSTQSSVPQKVEFDIQCPRCKKDTHYK